MRWMLVYFKVQSGHLRYRCTCADAVCADVQSAAECCLCAHHPACILARALIQRVRVSPQTCSLHRPREQATRSMRPDDSPALDKGARVSAVQSCEVCRQRRQHARI